METPICSPLNPVPTDGAAAHPSPKQLSLPDRPEPFVLAGVRVDRMNRAETLDWLRAALAERHRAKLQREQESQAKADRRAAESEGLESKTPSPRRTAAHESAAAAPPLVVVGPNAHIVSEAQRVTTLLWALAQADLAVADGASVVLASRLLGKPIPERITGGELMESLCALAAQEGYSVYFLGGLPGAAEGAARELSARYPGLRVVGTECPQTSFTAHLVASARVVEHICEAQPDLLFVALGVPKQERWIMENVKHLPVLLAMSVGAALDTQSGLRKRAPRWTHRIGMEWAYRMLREPRRLGRRYLVCNSRFVRLTWQAWRAQKKK